MMRDRIRFVACLLLLVGAASACSKSASTTPSCAYSLSSTAQAAVAAGGSSSVVITRTSGSCSWTAASNVPWITFSTPASGSDTGTLTYAIAANTGTASREGTIAIQWSGGSAQLVVSQPGTPPPPPCTYTVSPTSQSVPAAGGPSAATVTTSGAGCAWSASSDASWITITAGSSGTSSGPVAYTVAAAIDSVPRTGTITVQWAGASAQVVVQQAGVEVCLYTLSPGAQSVTAAGGNFSLTVTRNTPSGCNWSVTSSSPWITLTGNQSGSSPGTITYTVAQHVATTARTGTLTIAWTGGSTSFTVTQDAQIFNGSITLFDPGRQIAPSTECQIRSSTNVPTTCTLAAATNLPTAVVTYDWLVTYNYGTQRALMQTNASPTLTFQETCGQFSASDGGTAETLSVRVTMTDAVGNTVTIASGSGGQPDLRLIFFTCGK
jgi:hypothetical protein